MSAVNCSAGNESAERYFGVKMATLSFIHYNVPIRHRSKDEPGFEFQFVARANRGRQSRIQTRRALISEELITIQVAQI